MANVSIKFNGKEFLLSCEDGQEEHLEELSNNLNDKFLKLKSELGSIGESKLLLITSIKVIDEYFETKKKIEEKKKEISELKTLYSDPKKIPEEIKKEVASKIKQKQSQLSNLYNSPREVITLEKIGKWSAVQIVKVFLGMPIVPGR